jgi:hypothetical protein
VNVVSHSHIAALVNRYEHDELAQLLLVVEQLDLAAEMLRSDSVASIRAALILLDHHAEILLRRHSESLFRAGDGKGPFVGRAFKDSDRGKIRDKFERKIDVAAGTSDLGDGVVAIIDRDTAACLRLAHRHRNAAYHRDDHNPGVLQLICLLQLQAVCGLLAATTSRVTVGVREEVPVLLGHGIEASDTEGLRHAIDLRDAAERVAASITSELELPFEPVKAAFAEDLLDRGRAAIGVVVEVSEAGLPEYNLYFAIEHDEFWDKHGSDEQLVELRQRSDPWHRAGPGESPGRLSDEVEADMTLANDLRNERYIELRQAFRPKARQEAAIAAVKQVEKLLGDDTLGKAVERYDRLDRELAVFERYLPAAVRALDAMEERAVDYALER